MKNPQTKADHSSKGKVKGAASLPPLTARSSGFPWWGWALVLLALFLGVLEVYRPAMNGPFVYDDLYQVFAAPNASEVPLMQWIKNPRPLVMLSYWINFQMSGQQPDVYHLTSVVLHFLAAIFVGFALYRLLKLADVAAPVRPLLAGFGAAIFLLHPAQTDAVAYIASRSENLATLFYFAAFVVFLYRRTEEISWFQSIIVLALFGAAGLSKEYAITLPALFLLTDYYWNPGFQWGGAKRNWRVYALFAGGGAVAIAGIIYILSQTTSVGLGAWHEYFFTQCRAIWVYVRMFFLPVGYNVDHDFPVSKSLVDYGALIGLVALVAASGVAFRYRREFPLASYGWFVFLLLLSPTSSVIPIQDVLVDRRLYLPMFGLILISLDVVRRIPLSRSLLTAGLVSMLFLTAAMAHQRNQVWSDAVSLWKDAAEKSPRKMRPRFQYAFALYNAQRCVESAQEYREAVKLPGADETLYIDAALAYQCAGNADEAIATLQKVLTMVPTKPAEATRWRVVALNQAASIEAQRGRNEEALRYLEESNKLDKFNDTTLTFTGNVRLQMNQPQAARDAYRAALSINPRNDKAQLGLQMVARQLGESQ